MSESPMLTVTALDVDLGHGFGTSRVLSGIDLVIQRGSAVGVVGESGSGKSTLAKSIVGIHRPAAGSIVFDGTELTGASRGSLQSLRRRLQYIPQDPFSSLDPRRTVGQTLAEAIDPVFARLRQHRARIGEALASVALDADAVDRYPHEFSGGQRQRIAISRALVVNPDVIIADEITSALDVSTQAEILKLLARLRHELGLTMLFISHNLAVVEELCDEVVVLLHGEVIERGATADLFADPREPYTRTLLESVPGGPAFDISAPPVTTPVNVVAVHEARTRTTEAFSVVEADINRLRAALDAGEVTSVELVARYLNRIGAFDRSGIRLNAVPVLNPRAFDEARAADLRRARGEHRGPLDGIPFTAKDSYRVTGLTVAAGSPAFAEVIASDDAFAVKRLREAGAVLLGLTNMPPMAAGGMQRGLYGRAESPYNGDYLASAFGSGSSNGSGSATAASFAAFGLGEETWSSGRAPASHNALVAYTPSRGLLSVRGNWPLVPTMDVVVPHTRTMDDLRHVLDVVVSDDPESEGDLWRTQPWIALPRPSEIRPASFADLEHLPLRGLRFAVPRIYINGDPDNASPIVTRGSVMRLWHSLRADLEAAGAEVIETDFPVVDRYEKLHPEDQDFLDRGFVTRQFLDDEVGDLAAWAMDNFLRQNADPTLNRIADADAANIFPQPPGALRDRYGIRHYDISYNIGEYVERVRGWNPDWRDIPSLEAGLRGLEHTRRVDFEEWLKDRNFDAVIFPTQSDVGPADADVNASSADIAWRNGVWVSNGNLVPRHLGIPTVVVPMGTMEDTGMPVGLTIAGPAYSDIRLVQLGSAIAVLRDRRTVPPRTPALPDEAVLTEPRPAADSALRISIDMVAVEDHAEHAVVRFTATVAGAKAVDIGAYVNGARIDTTLDGDRVSGMVAVPARTYSRPVSEWIGPYGPLVVVVARDALGGTAGAVATTPLSPL